MFESNIIYNCNCIGRDKSYEYHICDRTFRTPVSLQEISTVYLLVYLNNVTHKHSLHNIGGATFDVLWGLVALPLPETLKRSIVAKMRFLVKPREELTFVRQEVRWESSDISTNLRRTFNTPMLVFQSHTTLSLEFIESAPVCDQYKNVIFLDIEGIAYDDKELFTNYIKTNCHSFRSEINTRWPDYIETTNYVPSIFKNDLIPIYDFISKHFWDYATLAFRSDAKIGVKPKEHVLPTNTCTSLVVYVPRY